MNFFDIIILIITVITFVRGVFKGFISALATLAALILGIMGAVLFSGLVAKGLSNFISTNFIPAIAFLILFIGIVIGVHLISKLIDKLVRAVALSWLNKILGGIFASLKAITLVSIFILVIDVLSFGTKIINPTVRESSHLFYHVKGFAPVTFNFFSIGYEHLMPKKEVI